MFKTPILKLAVAATLLTAATAAHAQDSGALVDKLVKKGVLTDQEAEEVRADMMRDFSQTSAGKLNLTSSVTELKIYGDFRFRYQYDDREAQIASPNNVSQRSRWRFRLRLNADIQLTENFFAGVGLETGISADSGNQTYDNGFDDYNIYISKAYLGWKPTEWFTVVLGKQKNPFYTTDLVWDPDINPQGAVETIAFHKMNLGGGGASAGGYSKDGTAYASSEVVSVPNWELTLVAGQFIFDDNNEFNSVSTLGTDAYMFVQQLIGTYKFNSNTSVTVAPGFMTYTAAALTGLQNENPFTDVGAINSGTTAVATTTTDAFIEQVTYSAAGVPTLVRTPTTITTATATTLRPNATGTSQPQTVTTNQVANRSGQQTLVGAASGLATDPSRAGTQTTTTVQTASSTTITTNNTTLPASTGNTNQQHIITAPGDISFKIGSLKSKFYWDFAYNLSGEDRYNEVYQLGSSAREYDDRDALAWLVGFQVGETKKKGDWAVYLNYRETGIASVDPNLNDSDFALGELNTRGFKLSLAWQPFESVVLNLTGMTAWNIEKNLIGGRATNSPAIAQDNAANVIQVDVNVKF